MATSRPSDPLPVRIFHTAMQRQLSLDEYATALDVPGDELRALLSARTDRVAPETVTRLAAAHGQGSEVEHASLAEVIAEETFSSWLGRNMEGVSQTSLRARARLDAPLLRAFLSGKALPDADQAERIARALYVKSADMAPIIVADMARRASSPLEAQAQRRGAAAEGGEGATAAPSPDRPEGRRPARSRRRAALDPADGTPAAPVSLAAPAPPSGSNDRRPPQEGPSSGDAGAAEPIPGRRRRASARAAAEPAARAAAEPAARVTPEATASSAGEREDATLPAAAKPAPPTPSAAADAPPVPTRSRGRQPRAAQSSPPAGAPAIVADPAPLPAADVPPRARRGRAASADAAASAPSALNEGAAAHSTGHAASSDASPGAASVSVGMSPAATPAEVQPVATTLQLSPDEVRLIRSWRRLHPHGQRATLQYIGSLLIEE